jgi:DNA-directed RNA polymerase specialized sigma24 family protein
MQALPREFLAQLAKQHYLSDPQEQAFTATFSSGGSQAEIAQAIGISVRL